MPPGAPQHSGLNDTVKSGKDFFSLFGCQSGNTHSSAHALIRATDTHADACEQTKVLFWQDTLGQISLSDGRFWGRRVCAQVMGNLAFCCDVLPMALVGNFSKNRTSNGGILIETIVLQNENLHFYR